MPADRNCQEILALFENLCSRPTQVFPQKYQSLDVPTTQGVYIIRKRGTVLHVGRTISGRAGLHQRLRNHLNGASSFTNKYLNGDGALLRKTEYTYQYLVLADKRKRALREAYTTGTLCPKHIGLG